MATDQLLLSDAVDRAVANIDFSPLRNEMVYLDTQYIRQVKGSGFVNADYIISSLRQQMVLAGLLLQEDREQALFIVEAPRGCFRSGRARCELWSTSEPGSERGCLACNGHATASRFAGD